MTDGATSQPVRRRKVFYLPGYDPFPARRYRELYRRESAAQAVMSGYRIDIEGTPGGADWRVRGSFDGTEVVADVTVLVWSDLVRASMSGALFASYRALVKTAWIYLRTGALGRLMRLRKGPVIAALYPVIALLLQLGLAVLFGWMAVRLVGLDGVLAVGTFSAVAAVVLWAFYKLDHHLFAHYLMRDYAYSAGLEGAYPPELQDRLEVFADQVAASLDGSSDEVLVIGHSSGAYLAVSVLATLLRTDRVPADASLAFLSLGQVVPMVSALPGATQLRQDLKMLGHQNRIFWLDVSAPGDGCAFALCDPVAVSGMAEKDQTGPLVLSARFTETLRPETWARLRWRFFRLHFQYLCAFDRPADYDYFAITGGPLSLKARFADRRPSPSVLRRSVAP